MRTRGCASSFAVALSLDLLLHLPSTLASPASILSTVTASDSHPDALSDGSGSAPYLTSPSFLLFAIINLLLGLFLITYGHRGSRVTTGIGTGLLSEFLVWVIIVNTLSQDGFSKESSEDTSIIIWAVVTAAGLVGAGLGSYFWRVGTIAMGACAGLSLGFSVTMMGDGTLPPIARWIVIGLLAGVGLVVLPLFVKTVGMAIASAFTGSFLLWLSIDLFVNKVDGMSLGLRYILDTNSSHPIPTHRPPDSTRGFLVLIWVTAIASSVFESWFFLYRHHIAFDHTLKSKTTKEPSMITNEGDIETDFASDYRLPSFSTGLGDGFDMASFDAQRRYREALETPTTPEPAHFDSRGTSPLLPRDTLRKIAAIQHTHERSSPDDPPSRPNSIVSTAFAVNLRSRPPTFFDDLPKNSAHTPPLNSIPLPLTTDLAESSYFPCQHHSESTDAAGTSHAGNRRPSIQPSLPVGPETDAGTPFERSTGSMEAYRAFDAFESGLLSGNTTSIALSRSTPTTEAFSTLLGPNLDTPPIPKTPEYDQLRDRGKPDVPQSPTVVISDRPSLDSSSAFPVGTTTNSHGLRNVRTPELSTSESSRIPESSVVTSTDGSEFAEVQSWRGRKSGERL